MHGGLSGVLPPGLPLPGRRGPDRGRPPRPAPYSGGGGADGKAGQGHPLPGVQADRRGARSGQIPLPGRHLLPGGCCPVRAAEGLCRRLYELCDNWGLAHPLLSCCWRRGPGQRDSTSSSPQPHGPGAAAPCAHPGAVPGVRLQHLRPALPGQAGPYRRLRIDAMADQEQLRRNKGRLRFSRKMSAALVDEAVEAMAQAKAMHDTLEALYNPHVDLTGSTPRRTPSPRSCWHGPERGKRPYGALTSVRSFASE